VFWELRQNLNHIYEMLDAPSVPRQNLNRGWQDRISEDYEKDEDAHHRWRGEDPLPNCSSVRQRAGVSASAHPCLATASLGNGGSHWQTGSSAVDSTAVRFLLRRQWADP